MLTKRFNPPSSWIWLLGLYTIASLAETIFYSHLVAFTPLYLPALGVAQENIGLLVGIITSASNFVGLPFLPIWGALADRYSRKPMIVRTYVILLLASVLSLVAGGVWLFAAARAFTAFALGNSGLMLTTLAERAPKQRLGLAFSIMNSASPVGAFLGPLIGGPAVDRWGFPVLLGIDSLLLLAIVLALSFGYHDEFQGEDRGPILKMAFGALVLVWRSLRLRTLFPALFFLFGGWMLAFTYVPLAITSLYSGGDPATAVGLVLGAGGLTTLILGPTLGALADRYGHWRVLFIGAVLALVLWPLPAVTSGFRNFLIAWAILNGVVSATFALSFSVLSSSVHSEERGRVMALAYLPVNVGFAIGPFVGTLIIRSSVFNIFPAAALFTALGLALLWVAHRYSVKGEESA